MKVEMAPNLDEWVQSARRGERITYHVGNLFFDRGLPAVRKAAGLAWTLQCRGTVHLVQRRLGYNRFAYIAERR